MKRILWFRRDLRVEDNPLLSFDGEVLPIFIFDTTILSKLKPNDKRLTFIFRYVAKLKSDLMACGLNLKVFYGDVQEIFTHLATLGFDEVAACGDYDGYAKERDKRVSHKLHFRYLQDTYLFRHDEVMKSDGTPYLVFTPFYKKALEVLAHKNVAHAKRGAQVLIASDYEGIFVHAKGAFQKVPFALESIGFEAQNISITPPLTKLEALKKKLSRYREERDYPALDATSDLSVDLRFGTIGVRQIVREIAGLEGSEAFVRQLIFRDFYAYLLFHMPRIERENFKHAFNGIADQAKFELFCNAKTGVPIVDAGVRELLETGNIHNRVRMVCASFFTKDLLLPWQWGEAFFAEHLLDFDKASNVLSWQWSAGTGVDPQPYFRVFNPYLQSKKFDSEGRYIKKYLPALAHLPTKYLHDEAYLSAHAIEGYPKPIVHHKDAAKKAVELFRGGL
jgi:deoxyribodipyrimidine photo-lyase